MRFNNKKETNIVPSVYIIVVAVFITNIFAAIEIKYDDVPFNYSSLIPNAVALTLAVYIFIVGRYFEFDSDGETLNLKSNGLLISKFFPYREQRTEIPKSKLISFKIDNYFFYKKLHIFIKIPGIPFHHHHGLNGSIQFTIEREFTILDPGTIIGVSFISKVNIAIAFPFDASINCKRFCLCNHCAGYDHTGDQENKFD